MRKSAGLLMYRVVNNEPEVFLIHPGGPFWQGKEKGAWSIPKGEFTEEEEEALLAAKREFEEETGTKPTGHFKALTPIKQKGGKMVYAWAVQGNINAETIKSNFFKMQWPPKSGQWKTYAEVDKAAWFTIPEAIEKINASQALFIQELLQRILMIKNT